MVIGMLKINKFNLKANDSARQILKLDHLFYLKNRWRPGTVSNFPNLKNAKNAVVHMALNKKAL
jgi:ribosomal protein S2